MKKRNERGLTCNPIMWSGSGQQLVPDDDQHASRWEVRDGNGNVLGFIKPDRAMAHPEMMWMRESAEYVDLNGEYKTVEEAFAAF